MASEKSKVPRSLIPIKTKSANNLHKLPQINEENSFKEKSSKLISITTSTKKEVTRNVSISQLATNNSVTSASCPSIFKPMRQQNSDNSLREDLKEVDSTAKINAKNNNINTCNNNNNNEMKPENNNENQKSSQRVGNDKNKTNALNYSKFSPYYEQKSLEYSADSLDIYQSSQTTSSLTNVSKKSQSPESESNTSSADSCISKEKQEIVSVINRKDSLLYRTQSVPERMVTAVYADDDNWMLREKSLISQLKAKMQLHNDSNEESDENLDPEKNAYDIDINVPPNVENKLLRIVIRHLRKQLNLSKSTIDKLSQQLNSNRQVTEAYQKSLSAMTIRAQQLNKQLEDKHNKVEDLLIDLKDKRLEVEDLKKKMSNFEFELKKQKKSVSIIPINSDNNSLNNSSMSTHSCFENNNDLAEDKKSKNKWLHTSTLSKAFKRKKIHSKSISYKSETESVIELKNILREKEMMITDMRLGSLAVNHRLEQLEDALKNSKEETNNLKKNKEFLEKVMKSKIIE